MTQNKRTWILVMVIGLMIVLLNCLKLLGIFVESDKIYILASLIVGMGLTIASCMKLRKI